MTWPVGAVSTTNVDATSDDPELGVVDIKSAFDKLNQIIAHVSSFVQGLLDDSDAATARTTLGLGALAVKATIATADVDNDAITYAKIQNVSATDKLLGRSTSGAGDVEEIACTAAARSILDDASVAAILTTLGGAPLASPTFTGTPLETMGTGSGTAALIGKAHINTTTIGNVGGGPDDLMSYALPANSLSANGKGVRITAWGKTASNANVKTLTPVFGSNLANITFTTSILGAWWAEIIVLRTGASTQKMAIRLSESGYASLSSTPKLAVIYSALAEADTAAITVKFVATTVTADNDITQEGMIVEYIG